MEAAKASLERILTAGENLRFLAENARIDRMSEEERKILTDSDQYMDKFNEAMDDDCNTADALAAIFELVKFINSRAAGQISRELADQFYQRLDTLMQVCGLILDQKEDNLDAEIDSLIEERQEARRQKDFARADRIRDDLLARGIVLEDTREGVKWHRA